MKQLKLIHRSHLFLVMLVTLAAIFIYSCQKEQSAIPEAIEEEPIGIAMEVFRQKNKETVSDTSNMDYRQKLGRTVDWGQAYYNRLGDTLVVFAPVGLSEALYYYQDDSTSTEINSWIRLLNAGDTWQIQLITMFPDSVGQERFSGLAIVNDWYTGVGVYSTLLDGRPVSRQHYLTARGNSKTMLSMGGVNCTSSTYHSCVTAGSYTHCTAHTSLDCTYSDEGPMPEEYQGPGEGGGGGPGYNPPPPTKNWDIKNEIDNPCLRQTIDKSLNRSKPVMGLITDIIKELDGDNIVNINVIDGITKTGRPGEVTNSTLTTIGGVPKRFVATIVLHENYMPDASQEGALAIFIHEVLHAYLQKADLINKAKTNQHQTMATKYVAPMASYLQELFGLSQYDAFSLAWAGLTYTGAYANVTSFDIGGTTYLKSDVTQASSRYMGRGADGNLIMGRELCDN
ncbi:hypothetical protein [Parapedobacter koreensis]|uniref:Uncharacterized protein n=1 Tax=Parapedobacter koreensis TaxID=332977 RepID=A0A1H7USI9_9SPHI|nr:hypothetical protein [Parapedobacter koreensis]SEL99407.1 hypothetical protein SAMN05421740_1227 [Parapedobacter koreensis]